ncbi:TPA: PTS sugar transporter subunit IIA [Streptococcus suis]|nr:PTS sugar transporter subunit IIA [Streptococcus suis]
MKLTQREIDLLHHLFSTTESRTISSVQEKLSLTTEQIRYSLTKINQFYEERGIASIIVDKDSISFLDRENAKREFEFFVSHTTPGEFKLTSQQLEHFILLKLLISDEWIPIRYFVEVLSISRTSVVNCFVSVRNLCQKEGIILEYRIRQGYRISDYSRKRFIWFVNILMKLVNIREIYSFYYENNLYSKIGDIILFDLFDVDLLFEAIEKANKFAQEADDSIDDASFLQLAILEYKILEASEAGQFNEALQIKFKQYLQELHAYYGRNLENENQAELLIKWLNQRLEERFGLRGLDQYRHLLLQHVQRCILRYNNHTMFEDLEPHRLIKGYYEMYETLFQAIQEFSDGKFERMTESEVALISLYYINLIEEKNISRAKKPRILIICAEGRAVSRILKGKISRLIEVDEIKTIAVYEYDSGLLDYYDMILTTVHLSDVNSRKVIYIENAFSENFLPMLLDRLNSRYLKYQTTKISQLSQIMEVLIEEFGTTANLDRVEKKLINLLSRESIQDFQEDIPEFLFSDDFVCYHEQERTWEQAIMESTKILEDSRSITKDYTDKIIYNIKQFGMYMEIAPGVILAHAGSNDGVLQNGLSMHIFKKPIQFWNRSIQVIIVLAVENQHHYRVIEEIVYWITKEETLQSLTNEENRDYQIDKINRIVGKG